MSPKRHAKEFASLKTAIQSAKKILVSTHQLPDGDGLGAEVALYHYLKRAGKQVRIYNPDPVPTRYKFLDPQNKFMIHQGQMSLWEKFDLWIIVDTNDPRRMGKIWDEVPLRAKKIMFLDHHPDLVPVKNLHYPPHATVVCDTSSSSIGELLYGIFLELNLAKIDHKMALGLYVSVMTDTNSFRYARTTPAAHNIAAHMIELGVNPEEVYQAIFSSKELSHVQLLGELLQKTKVAGKGQIAWMEMRLSTRKHYRATADDTQSFLNLLLLLKDAEIVCLFREEDDGRVRVSLKSKGRVIVNKIAMEFGGGGHDYAAGLALKAPFDQVVQKIIRGLERDL
jgi:bifunctional oligoribonuclease and PAP phosphatase NrnA